RAMRRATSSAGRSPRTRTTPPPARAWAASAARSLSGEPPLPLWYDFPRHGSDQAGHRYRGPAGQARGGRALRGLPLLLAQARPRVAPRRGGAGGDALPRPAAAHLVAGVRPGARLRRAWRVREAG